jgi:hypothetical protein
MASQSANGLGSGITHLDNADANSSSAMLSTATVVPLAVPRPRAMAAKVTERLWEIGDIVGVLEAWEAAQVRRSI